jgi:drug/metabolite transporter (DMT)-like permease
MLPSVRKELAMSWTKVGLLILLAVMMASGQLLFKVAAQSIKEPIAPNLHSILQLAFNPYLLFSLAIYGVATILWVLLLRDTDLNRAYLVFALSLVLVPLAGTLLFHEQLSYRLLVGMAIILLGLAVALG